MGGFDRGLLFLKLGLGLGFFGGFGFGFFGGFFFHASLFGLGFAVADIVDGLAVKLGSAETRALAATLTQVAEIIAANLGTLGHLYLEYQWAMDKKAFFNADSGRNFADGDPASQRLFTIATNNYALKHLSAFFVAFFDFLVNPNGITTAHIHNFLFHGLLVHFFDDSKTHKISRFKFNRVIRLLILPQIFLSEKGILSVMDYNKLALELHKKYKGKISMKLRDSSELDKAKLSAYYTPGVAEVSRTIAADESQLPVYTWTNNLVAVISDGSAVLGLGDIGPKGAMPVMEGKALLFKRFADIDSVPIVLDVHDTEEIIAAVKAIAPSFGAINLEDIAAPRCFEIEERLKAELDIPVFHDDQHGTAVVVLAGLINAMKVVGKELKNCKVVTIGAGAAGTAIMKLLHLYGVGSIVAVDSKGIMSDLRDDLNDEKKALLPYLDSSRSGSLDDAIEGADVFIGVSKPGLLTSEMVTKMADKPVVFSLANPTPEIMPDEAKKAGAAVVATGRSDFPNQVNNALAFPGIFRGALDNGVKKITDQHKIAAAEALASLVDSPSADEIIPSPFDDRVVSTVSRVMI